MVKRKTVSLNVDTFDSDGKIVKLGKYLVKSHLF